MSRFGNLLGGNSEQPTPAPATPVESAPEPVVQEVVTEVPVEKDQFEEMSKRQLEKYGRKHGIELDRRHSKDKLVQELKEHLDG